MARVPVYQSQVRSRAAYQQGVEVRASPDAFGAAIGEGMVGLARGVGHLGDVIAQRQQEDAEALMKDYDVRLADAFRREQLDPENGFLMTQGRNAMDGYGPHQQRLRAIKDQTIAELRATNPRAAELLQRAADAREQDALNRAATHTGGQRQGVLAASSAARAESLLQDAIAATGDEKRQNEFIRLSESEIRQAAQEKGATPDMVELELTKHRTTARLALATQLAQTDPEAAEAYVGRYAGEMTASDVANFKAKIKPLVVEHRASKRTVEILAAARGKAGSSPAAGGLAMDGTLDAGAAGGDYQAVGMAAALLRSKEGFRSNTYWDVNHHRVGYGSDTITRADGSVVRVEKGMTVTREDAERDLERRIRQTQADIVGVVGMQAFVGLDEATKGAITSVAYNYGRLPNRVAQAVVTGDKEAIAQAIEELAGHNGGVNAKRRADEAAMVRTGQLPAGGEVGAGSSGGWGSVSYGSLMDQIAAIEDPDERELVRKQISGMLELQDKMADQARESAKMEAFEIVTNGGDPGSLSAELKMQLGVEGMKSLYSYQETLAKQGEIQTDWGRYYELKTMDRKAFGEIDLNTVRHQIGTTEFKELVGEQQAIRKGDREALTKGATHEEVARLASNTLDRVGLTTTGKQDAEKAAAEQRIATFNRQLLELTEEFRKANEREPTRTEAQRMIDGLLLPIILEEPGVIFGTNETDGFAFEAPFRSDLQTVKPAVEYSDIPMDLRRAIEDKLWEDNKRAGKQPPTPSSEEIAAEYFRWIQSTAGTTDKQFEEMAR